MTVNDVPSGDALSVSEAIRAGEVAKADLERLTGVPWRFFLNTGYDARFNLAKCECCLVPVDPEAYLAAHSHGID